MQRPAPRDVDLDLVECVVVAVPGRGAVEGLTPAITELVVSETIRLLDLVCASRSASDSTPLVTDPEQVGGIAGLRSLDGYVGGLLSDHDIEVASRAIEPGSTAVILLVEDRWAGRLSAAAHRGGGRVLGGERVERSRVTRALESTRDQATRSHPDLLPPPGRGSHLEGRWSALLIDPAAQLAELADLVDRGLVTPEEFERQRRKVFGA